MNRRKVFSIVFVLAALLAQDLLFAGDLKYEFGANATPNFKEWFIKYMGDYYPLLKPLLTTASTRDKQFVVDFKIEPQLRMPEGTPGHIMVYGQGDLLPPDAPPDAVFLGTRGELILTDLVGYQATNGLHTPFDWVEARTAAITIKVAQEAVWKKLRPSLGSWPGFFEMKHFDQHNQFGRNILAGFPWPFTEEGMDPTVAWRYNPVLFYDIQHSAMWWILDNASGRSDFFGKFNELYLAKGQTTAQSVKEVLDVLVPKIDGMKPSIWLDRYSITGTPKAGRFFNSVSNGSGGLMHLYLERDEKGKVSYPGLLSPFVVEYTNTSGKRIPFQWRPFEGEKPDYLMRQDLIGYEGDGSSYRRLPGVYRIKVITEVRGEPLIGTHYGYVDVYPDWDKGENTFFLPPSNLTFMVADPKKSQIATDAKVNDDVLDQIWSLQASNPEVTINGKQYTVPMPELYGPPNPATNHLGRYARELVDAEAEYYTPLFSVTGSQYLGLALTNSGKNGPASARMELWQNGALIKSASVDLGEQTQIAKLIPEWFGAAVPNQPGFVKVIASTEEVKAFYLYGSNAARQLDGANAHYRWGKRFLLPPGASEVAVLNPNVSGTDVVLERFSSSGAPTPITTSQPLAVSSGNTLTRYAVGPAPGYTIVRLSEPGFVTALGQGADGPEFQLVEGFDLDRPITGTTYFPHLASGEGWDSILSLLNVGDAGNVTLSLLGIPVELQGSVRTPVVTLPLGTNQNLQQSIRDLFGITTDQVLSVFIKIESTHGVKLGGFVSFFRSGGAQAILALPDKAYWDFTLNQLATNSGWFTGVAILNIHTKPVDVWVSVYQDGKVLGRKKVAIGAGQRLVRLIEEIVPEATNKAGGYIHIVAAGADQPPLYVVGLFGRFTDNMLASLAGQPQ